LKSSGEFDNIINQAKERNEHSFACEAEFRDDREKPAVFGDPAATFFYKETMR